jgi:SAM-dependent methyltransferase
MSNQSIHEEVNLLDREELNSNNDDAKFGPEYYDNALFKLPCFEDADLYKEHAAAIIKIFDDINSILDLGCGLGQVCQLLSESHKYEQIVGIDVSSYALEKVIKAAPDLKLVQFNKGYLPLVNNSFDLVFSSEVFEHVPRADVLRLVNEAIRVSKRYICFSISLAHVGIPSHITLRPKQWWRAVFAAQGLIQVPHIEEYLRNNLNTPLEWFCYTKPADWQSKPDPANWEVDYLGEDARHLSWSDLLLRVEEIYAQHAASMRAYASKQQDALVNDLIWLKEQNKSLNEGVEWLKQQNQNLSREIQNFSKQKEKESLDGNVGPSASLVIEKDLTPVSNEETIKEVQSEQEISHLVFGKTYISVEEIRGKAVLEVGSYQGYTSLQPLLKSFEPSSYIGIDQHTGKGVDEVCDAANLLDRFGPNSFDVIISTEVIEHIKDWRNLIHAMKLVLRPNGILVLTTRSKGYPYHGAPADFWRYELSDMKTIFSDFIIEALEPDPAEPGVFIKACKPDSFIENDLSQHNLYSINAEVSADAQLEATLHHSNELYNWNARLQEDINFLNKEIRQMQEV